MPEEDDSIERAAIARRERLKALKAAQELLSTPDDAALPSQDVNGSSATTTADATMVDATPSVVDVSAITRQDDEDDQTPSVKFRNYLPHDKQLQEGKVAPPVRPKFEDAVAEAAPPAEEAEDPFVNIAPKKPNWDLRRDVQKKLDKLERRTQKAIYKLMQEQEKQKQASLEENGEDMNVT